MSLPTPLNWPRERVEDHVAPAMQAVLGTLLLIMVLAGGSRAEWLVFAAFLYVAAYRDLSRPARPVATGGALAFAVSRARRALVVAQGLAFPVYVAVRFGLPWGVVVGAASLALEAYFVRRFVLEVTLDADGITVRTTRSRRHVPWARFNDAVRMPRPGVLYLDDGPRLRTDDLPADPVVLYWTLQHYAARPQDRDELADGRAVERVRDEDLAAGTEAFEMAELVMAGELVP